MSAKSSLVENTSTNRIILGAPPKSKSGGLKAIKFDTHLDDGVPANKRVGRRHIVGDDRVELIRGKGKLAAIAEKLGLRVSEG